MVVRSLLIGVVVLVMRLLTFPRTPWDAAEMHFPFAKMVAISIAASVITAVALVFAYERMLSGEGFQLPAVSGDKAPGTRCPEAGTASTIAALLFSCSAAVLVHAPTARLDALSWMFVALALVFLHTPALLGVLTAGAIICQPSMAVSGLTLLIAAMFLVLRDPRERVLAAVAFVVTALPFATIPQNIELAGPLNILRFTLHPWGSKIVALPLLVCVMAGIRPLARRWNPAIEVLLWFAFVHVAVGIALIDPAEGARWAVPSLMFTALVAAMGLRALHATGIGAAILVALSVWYAFPILRDRVTKPSPAIETVRAIPPGVVVLHDRDTAAFAKGMPLDEGLRRYVDEPDVRLMHLARLFPGPDGDSYGKLTNNKYRHLALIPIVDRYAPLRGVHGVERNEAGESWRWLEQEAELRVPRGRSVAIVELRLPASSPIEANDIQINATHVTVRRGQSVIAHVPLEQPILLFRAARAFDLQAPDTRRVAVQLITVRSAPQ